MREVLDDIFGNENFICQFIWKSRQMVDNRTKTGASIDHEYIICYGRSNLSTLRGSLKDLDKFSNPDNDPRGPWRSADLTGLATIDKRPNLHYDLIDPKTGISYSCPPKGWRYDRETMTKKINEGRILFPSSPEGRPRHKLFLNEMSSQYTGFSSLISTDIYTVHGTRELSELFPESVFDFPKPTDLVMTLLEQTTNTEDLILDFFSGSATTAHSVMKLNSEDGGNRKYILIQLPEKTDETSAAYKSGFKNICEIGKERIRRAANKIKEETGADIDYGFRVYRVDSSNMKDVYYTPDKLGQMNLDDMASNIKEDRTGEDLLIQVMLECGLELSLPMESREIEGKTIHYVAGNSLIASFDEEVSETVIKKIAEDQPLRVVFRDSSFRDDSARINVEELFKLLSPSTEIQVL